MSEPERARDHGRTRAQEAFVAAPEPYRELLRVILQAERDVMHLRRRSEIHQRICEHVKRMIK